MPRIVFAVLLAVGVWALRSAYGAEGPFPVRVHFLDVGQGDSALLELGERSQVLVDGGPDENVVRELGRRMPRFDRRLELVVVSHPHLDHYGGLLDVFDRYAVGVLLVNQGSDAEPYRALIRKAERSGARIVRARGQSLPVGQGRLTVLYPVTALPDNGNPKDASIVLRVDLFGRSFLFPGDAEEAEERRLVELAGLDTEVLKVPHHGSRTSSTQEFLARTSPRWCVVSLGRNNRYGHPHRATQERLVRSGCRTLRTDRRGTITFEAGPRGVRIRTAR